ncbi:cysteine desulfurase IscS [Clostridia bacterium]|nr:cysteine desulfurase IscS [Clostridia bacterium]
MKIKEMKEIKDFIYFDNAATTKVSASVLESMLPYLGQIYFNPSSIYSASKQAKDAIEKARSQVATAIGAESDEVYFTSCATESNNWAFTISQQRGKLPSQPAHFITTQIEHPAVLNAAKQKEKDGSQVTYLGVDEEGRVSPDDLKKNIREDTTLVSIMYANNETGVIQPIDELANICNEKGVLFHTDAVQAAGTLPIDVKRQNIGMLSLSGHKFHAPKGVGVLYIKKGIPVNNFLFGGGQERGKRGGTENVANIVAIGQAIEKAMECMEAKNAHIKKLRKLLFDHVMQIPKVKFNGSKDHNLPNIMNFSFEGIEGEGILLHLSMQGICCSSGSACTSGSLDPSHVLIAMGLDHALAQGSLRISLSKYNTEQEITRFLEVLKPTIEKLRAMSPIWQS